jgi:hypothetical protein
MKFFQSDLGVAISWICGVVGFIFAIFQKNENRKLKIQLQNSLNTTNTSNVDSSKDNISQNGDKNIYTRNNSGGMKIKM